MSYLKAEAFRFSRKKSFIALIALFTIIYPSIVIFTKPNAEELIFITELLIDMSPVLIGIALFVMIYADDIGAHSIQTPIGYGIARWKLSFYKIIEMVILLASIMAYALGLAFLVNILFNINADLSSLVKPLLQVLLTTTLYTSLAGFFALVFQKSSIAIIIFVIGTGNMIDSILELIFSLRWIANLFPSAVSYLPYRLAFDITLNGWQLQNAGIIGIYIAIITFMTILFFNKAELDF